MSVDLGTVALLAAVVWLDGWRRLPDDALVVSRSGFGPWTVSTPSIRMGSLALVAWWAPIVVPVVVQPQTADAGPAAARSSEEFERAVVQARARLRKVRWTIGLLRALGVALIAWIILGIPTATERFGGPGLLYSVLAAFGIALAIAVITIASLRALGSSTRAAVRAAAQLLSPFTAPRATEIVTGAAVGASSPMPAIMALVGESSFLGWIRPWAYDELAGRTSETANAGVAALVGGLPRRVLEQAVAPTVSASDADGARYCPRCMQAYRETIERCSDCSDLALVAVSSGSRQAIVRS